MTQIQDIKLARLFTERLPKRQQILGLYAVIVFLIYSWTLLVSFYKFPSWILYLTINQILTIYAYSFSTNFIESLFILACVLILDMTVFVLLKNRNEFQSRSTVLAIFVLASVMWRLLLFQNYEDTSVLVSGEFLWWTVTFLLAVPSAILISKIGRARSLIETFAERAIVFLYVYLPFSLISLAVVGIRNLY